MFAIASEIERFLVRYSSNIGCNLSSISPAIVEDAVKAKFGDGEWYPYLDKLLYKP